MLVLNSESGDYSEPTTYFLPSASAITGLAKLACFDVLATRRCSPQRFALIGRAALPEEVNQRTPTCEKIHEFGLLDESFHYKHLKGAPESSIGYSGPPGYSTIDSNTFNRTLPSHPDEDAIPLGAEVTEAKLREFIEKAG